ncbi:hypothetical protein NKH18_51205 [Streptomyces sp. M10(2022)]
MGAELYRDHDVYRDTVDACARILRPVLGVDLRDTLFDRRPTDDTATFLALVVTEYALARTLMAAGCAGRPHRPLAGRVHGRLSGRSDRPRRDAAAGHRTHPPHPRGGRRDRRRGGSR